jgi:hypothetical protein
MSDLPTHAAHLYGEQLLSLLRTYLAASKTQPMAVASSPITLNGTDCRLAVMSEELFAVLVVAAEEANKLATTNPGPDVVGKGTNHVPN